MYSRIWLLALVLGACTGADGEPGDTHEHGDDDDNPSEALDALPDLRETLEGRTHACEEGDAYQPEAAVASTYFIGEFTFDEDGVVKGTETWLLYANPRWKELGGYDCQVVWNVGGSVGEPVQRGHFSLSLSANVVPSQSDCPQDGAGNHVYMGEERFEVTYDVHAAEDGTAEFTFATSGNYLGAGYHNEGAANYITDLNCKIF